MKQPIPHVAAGLVRRAAFFLLLAALPAPLVAQTGTFIDRAAPTDLRVVSYNIHLDDIFADDNPTQAAKFVRVMQALQPDVIALQEIYNHTAAQTASLMNSILPLGVGATWYAHQAFDNVLVSKFPMSMLETRAVPGPPSTSYAMALVDLPDFQFATDFYFMDSHFKCCSDQGWEEERRQLQADALVSWMRDARTPGGFVTLPTGTPMTVLGDLNLVQTLNPLNTLITGDVSYEVSFGPDSPPDWDGTGLADVHPLHNEVGPSDYTYRSSGFSPSRLDYVLYTDSVADVAKSFVLNTVSMSAAERAATGLQQYDVTLSTSNYDHLPVVVDFRLPAPAIPGDFNRDLVVNALDYERWRQTVGSTDVLDADANGDQVVDAADYVLWRKYFANSGGGAAAEALTHVPEPASYLLCLVMLAGGAVVPRRQSR